MDRSETAVEDLFMCFRQCRPAHTSGCACLQVDSALQYFCVLTFGRVDTSVKVLWQRRMDPSRGQFSFVLDGLGAEAVRHDTSDERRATAFDSASGRDAKGSAPTVLRTML